MESIGDLLTKCRDTLTRLAALGTLSRNAGEGLVVARIKPLARTAGEGGPSPEGLVGEGLR
jgi:DNA-binding FadR family transcriptional regulator